MKIMSSYIQYEALLFLKSAALGVVLLLCYDLLVSLRRAIPHSPSAVACEDVLYWSAVGLGMFVQIYRFNQGILRSFLFLGILLGAVLCRVTISAYFVKLFTMIWRVPFLFVKKIIKRLLFPVKRCKISMCKHLKSIFRGARARKKRPKRSSRSGKVKKKDDD